MAQRFQLAFRAAGSGRGMKVRVAHIQTGAYAGEYSKDEVSDFCPYGFLGPAYSSQNVIGSRKEVCFDRVVARALASSFPCSRKLLESFHFTHARTTVVHVSPSFHFSDARPPPL